MLRKRVIPTLLIKNRGLVKTSGFKNPVYLGDPLNAIKIFNEKEVDELVIFDIDASRNQSGINWHMLNRINCEAFMPLGYGGGIKSIDDIKRIIGLGYEKVILNSILLSHSKIVETAAKIIGSQSLVVCLDIKKTKSGIPKIYNHLTEKVTDIDPLEYLLELESMGAGEAILHSVDNEGCYCGYDLAFINTIVHNVNIPVIALGGASTLNDIKEVFTTGISAAAAGSIFVFHGRLRAVLINYPDPEDLERIIF